MKLKLSPPKLHLSTYRLCVKLFGAWCVVGLKAQACPIYWIMTPCIVAQC